MDEKKEGVIYIAVAFFTLVFAVFNTMAGIIVADVLLILAAVYKIYK